MIETVRLPPPAVPGCRVGVAALSGPVDPVRLEAGLRELERLGFDPVPAPNLASRHGLFAGPDEERLAAFHELASDPSLAAIVFARGGHGLLRLLPRFDWELLTRHPRAYVGYSDLTPFLLQVVQRLGLVAFHGPMVATDLARGLSPDEEDSFLAALAGRPLDLPVHPVPWDPATLPPIEGVLLGGCLSLLASLPGTPWAPDLTGSLLFWEEVAEPLYRVDRMLTHLELAGWLGTLAGMVVGRVTPPRDPEEAERLTRGLDGVLAERAAAFGLPVATGLPVGHEAPNWTVPLGVRARLVEGAVRLEVGVA
ncbi:MAG: S66 peptidase family protein [Thermoanaerobaculia bacterium]